MSLTTTMGIELSYVPQAIQTALSRGATFEPASETPPGEGHLTAGLALLLRHIIKAKRIPVYRDPHTDPGCVEVPTRPYRKLSTLINVARRISREAESLGLTPVAEYTGGGGAHIHTGIIGGTPAECLAYQKRLLLFGAMNPWLSWACISVVDDINAAPITKENLFETNLTALNYGYVRELEQSVRAMQRNLCKYDMQCHRGSIYDMKYMIEIRLREAERYSRKRLQLHRLKKEMEQTTEDSFTLDQIAYSSDKEKMLRVTHYGRRGTIEFRNFEMGDEAKLTRNVILTNAICAYVEQWEIDKFNLSDIFTSEQLWVMSWREARDGWLRMLDLLGLDRADYRDETANIARRWRHWRAQGGNPAGIAKPEHTAEHTAESRQLQDARAFAVVVERATARHGRREAKRAAKAARHALRACGLTAS